MSNAIFTMLAVHFVFNIEYNHQVKDVLYFLQDKVLGFPDPGFKKSSVYMSISSAIDLYLDDWLTIVSSDSYDGCVCKHMVYITFVRFIYAMTPCIMIIIYSVKMFSMICMMSILTAPTSHTKGTIIDNTKNGYKCMHTCLSFSLGYISFRCTTIYRQQLNKAKKDWLE